MKTDNLFFLKAVFLSVAVSAACLLPVLAMPIAQQEYSLKMYFTDAPLGQVLDEFTSQTGVSFSYETSMEDIRLASVNVNATDVSLEYLLEQI